MVCIKIKGRPVPLDDLKMGDSRSSPDRDRKSLGFESAVQDACTFLVSDLGFRVSESEATFVRYESRDVFIAFYHGRRSYEIGVEVGRLPECSGGKYGLRQVLAALVGEPKEQNAYYFQSSVPEGVRRCVDSVADLVRAHYRDVLRADPESWRRVVSFTAERNRQYTCEIVQRPDRDAAERAWLSKDYDAVVRHYQAIQPDLTVVEKKRLEYAMKQLLGGDRE